MKFLFFCVILCCDLSTSDPYNDTQCIENPTGEVSLNVAVRGVPGPEGPRGPKGNIGLTGKMGFKGDHGVQGEKGERGDIGPYGPKGMKGETGKKGQKGAQGIQGIPGPPGLPGLEGPDGPRGYRGPDGPRGPPGQAGLPGPRGPRGKPGDTDLNEEEFDRVTNNVHKSVLANINSTVTTTFNDLRKKVENLNESVLQEVESRDEDIQSKMQSQYQVLLETVMAMNATLNDIKVNLPQTKCGIFGNWRRIAYFDTTQGDSCPTGLRTVTNTATKQTVCGRTGTVQGCTSVFFPSMFSYTRVCGKVRGYQHHDTPAFYRYNSGSQTTIDSTYTAGISITQGSPRQHLWTYVAGASETSYGIKYVCPCARTGYNSLWIPSFVGNNYYCESGLTGNFPSPYSTIWGDPLWDGNGCFAASNTCCNRYGWFYRDVQESSKYVEVRVCGIYQGYTFSDVPLDQLEIWVM